MEGTKNANEVKIFFGFDVPYFRMQHPPAGSVAPKVQVSTTIKNVHKFELIFFNTNLISSSVGELKK
jgi:hypothetical protein